MADESEKQAIELVKTYWAGANVRKVDILQRIEFGRGMLYVLSIYDANNDDHENYVYAAGGKLIRYDDLTQLIENTGLNPDPGIMSYVLQPTSVAGVIGIIVTLTISFLVLRDGGGVTIPDVLSNALAIILGFYFGTAVHKGAPAVK